MPWQQLVIDTLPEYVESLSDELSNQGALSVTFVDAATQPIYEPDPGETKLWQQTRVISLFTADIDVTSIYQQLISWHPHIQYWQIETLADQHWEQAWMDDFKPMRFGNRLWVAPLHNPPEDPDAITVALDPGLAFGTGTHPTTELCLRWLDQALVQQKSIIDYGCGSGILAIAACKLGAAKVWTVDHDPQALIATQRNAEHNQVADKIECIAPEDLPLGRIDILLANILANPLIELATQLKDYLKPDGQIILSGILTQQIDDILAAYTPHFIMQTPQIKDEWVCLSGIKKC